MLRVTLSACAFIAATVLAGLVVGTHPTQRAAEFVRPVLERGSTAGQAVAGVPLTLPNAALVGLPGQVAHASHLAVRPEGGLQVVWFSGTREGAADVQVLSSHSVAGAWSEPRALLTRTQLATATGKHIRKLGNPVLHVDAAGGLHLFVVSVSLGGWAGARIEHLRSRDGGATWSRPRSLALSPFINISTLVRAPALNTTDGGFVLPVYHEFLRKASELLVFDGSGELVTRHRLMAGVETLQPALVAVGAPGPSARMYMRNDIAGSTQMLSAPVDGLSQPGAAKPTNLPNRDSGLAAAVLPNGLTVVAYNPADRSRLTLAASADGAHFRDVVLVASGEGKEYSYPSLLLHGNDLMLSYTRERRHIAITSIPWRSIATALAPLQSGIETAAPALTSGPPLTANTRP